MSRYGAVAFLAILVILITLLGLHFRITKDEEILREESPKLIVKNPFWNLVNRLGREADKLLFIRDVVRISGGRFFIEGYISVRSKSAFERALMETVRIIGKEPEVYVWERGRLFRVKEYNLVVVYQR